MFRKRRPLPRPPFPNTLSTQPYPSFSNRLAFPEKIFRLSATGISMSSTLLIASLVKARPEVASMGASEPKSIRSGPKNLAAIWSRSGSWPWVAVSQ